MSDQVGGLSGKRVAVEPAKANEVFAVARVSAHYVIGEPGK